MSEKLNYPYLDFPNVIDITLYKNNYYDNLIVNKIRKEADYGDLPDLKEEFSDLPHERGTLSMARSQDPNSANSQFFICFKEASFLDRQYTVFGKVIEGMDLVDKIKRGDQNNNGSVSNPDKIISFR